MLLTECSAVIGLPMRLGVYQPRDRTGPVPLLLPGGADLH